MLVMLELRRLRQKHRTSMMHNDFEVSLKHKKSDKYNFCYPNPLGCMAFHWSLDDLPRVKLLKKIGPPYPSIFQMSCLSLLRYCAYCCNFCEFICATSQKHYLLEIIHHLWLLQSFCLLFHDDATDLNQRTWRNLVGTHLSPSSLFIA